MRNSRRECIWGFLWLKISFIRIFFFLRLAGQNYFVRKIWFFVFWSFDLRFPLSLAFNGQHEFDSFQWRAEPESPSPSWPKRKEIAIKMRANVSVANVASTSRLGFKLRFQLQLQTQLQLGADRAAIWIWIWQLARARTSRGKPAGLEH